MDTNTILLSLPIIFGIALFLTAITYRKMEFFFLWAVIVSSFFVWADLIDFSIVIILIIISVASISLSVYRQRGGL